MTHDELLAEIDMAYGLLSYSETSDLGLKGLQLGDYLNALRAVVELCEDGDVPVGHHVHEMSISRRAIYEAIEEELK